MRLWTVESGFESLPPSHSCANLTSAATNRINPAQLVGNETAGSARAAARAVEDAVAGATAELVTRDYLRAELAHMRSA